VCDPNYTVLAKVAKRYLGGSTAYAGIHDRLRALGQDYLGSR
jgi:amidase